VGVAEKISHCLAQYLKAVDVTVTRDLCKAHGLPAPTATDSPSALAVELLRLVRQLPELREAGTSADSSEQVADSAVLPEIPSARPNTRSPDLQPDKRNKAFTLTQQLSNLQVEQSPWPHLFGVMAKAPLVIVGGPPHLERLNALPQGSLGHVEWIDTTRQGTHAIGNLERRIRDQRIGAIVILEGLVQHRHTDPLISAARIADLPHCFAGKGGRAALLQALKELESRLAQRQAKR
jgi:hypothetical protein